VQLTAVARIFL